MTPPLSRADAQQHADQVRVFEEVTVRESAPFQVTVAFGKSFEPWIAAVSSRR